ncbi:hypothetical protein HYH03_010026 [Edaphochlamys debaryana]|uniref:Uncharacterized protein n=1 Tax=Edaphochlamys debaryana TaxID=47281 RepID=A0A835XWU5_9CHLO|nr:hypothetical protein HYH03_010026 [Edaphochlamys debaryana]|eukprot:KAG2491656.1 hypothetical protein HYH03_010026 [Edaphochlamys debaryana]
MSKKKALIQVEKARREVLLVTRECLQHVKESQLFLEVEAFVELRPHEALSPRDLGIPWRLGTASGGGGGGRGSSGGGAAPADRYHRRDQSGVRNSLVNSIAGLAALAASHHLEEAAGAGAGGTPAEAGTPTSASETPGQSPSLQAFLQPGRHSQAQRGGTGHGSESEGEGEVDGAPESEPQAGAGAEEAGAPKQQQRLQPRAVPQTPQQQKGPAQAQGQAGAGAMELQQACSEGEDDLAPRQADSAATMCNMDSCTSGLPYGTHRGTASAAAAAAQLEEARRYGAGPDAAYGYGYEDGDDSGDEVSSADFTARERGERGEDREGGGLRDSGLLGLGGGGLTSRTVATSLASSDDHLNHQVVLLPQPGRTPTQPAAPARPPPEPAPAPFPAPAPAPAKPPTAPLPLPPGAGSLKAAAAAAAGGAEAPPGGQAQAQGPAVSAARSAAVAAALRSQESLTANRSYVGLDRRVGPGSDALGMLGLGPMGPGLGLGLSSVPPSNDPSPTAAAAAAAAAAGAGLRPLPPFVPPSSLHGGAHPGGHTNHSHGHGLPLPGGPTRYVVTRHHAAALAAAHGPPHAGSLPHHPSTAASAAGPGALPGGPYGPDMYAHHAYAAAVAAAAGHPYPPHPYHNPYHVSPYNPYGAYSLPPSVPGSLRDFPVGPASAVNVPVSGRPGPGSVVGDLVGGEGRPGERERQAGDGAPGGRQANANHASLDSGGRYPDSAAPWDNASVADTEPLPGAPGRQPRRRRGSVFGFVKNVVGFVGVSMLSGAAMVLSAAAVNTSIDDQQAAGGQRRGGKRGQRLGRGSDDLIPQRAMQQLRGPDLLAMSRG